jgi:hypothetical protein
MHDAVRQFVANAFVADVLRASASIEEWRLYGCAWQT